MRIGFSELIFIFAIILLIFGPAKLPKLGRSIGEAIKNFKAGMETHVLAEDKESAADNEK